MTSAPLHPTTGFLAIPSDTKEKREESQSSFKKKKLVTPDVLRPFSLEVLPAPLQVTWLTRIPHEDGPLTGMLPPTPPD